MLKILAVEDDEFIRKLIIKYLSTYGFQMLEAKNGKEALEICENEFIDLVITDVMMPQIDGIELTKILRKNHPDMPILMLTALETIFDKEKGFSSGTDDYLVKPIDMKELLLRVKALLRRYKIVSENKIEYKSIFLNFMTSTAMIDGKSVELTQKEFLLLYKLIASPNIIFTRNQLMNEIWGYDSESFDRTVDTHIKRIREKMKTDDFELITVRGLGYKAVLK